jgi:hypothetical protein
MYIDQSGCGLTMLNSGRVVGVSKVSYVFKMFMRWVHAASIKYIAL